MNFLKKLTALLLIIMMVTMAFSADVPNKTVSVIEGNNYVLFYGTIAFSATDSTDNLTTQAVTSSWLDWENSTLRCNTNEASGIDVNLFVLGGGNKDLTYFSSLYTQTVFDDINTATRAWYALKDTLLDTSNAVTWFVDPVAGDRYKVLKFDGQAGNPATAIVYWYWWLPKKPGAPLRNAYLIESTE